MRFRLLEDNGTNAPFDITPEFIKEFSLAKPHRRKTMQHLLVNKMSKQHPNIRNLEEALYKSISVYGVDSSKNPFIEFIPILSDEVGLKSSDVDNVCELVDLVQSGVVDADRIRGIVDNSESAGGYLIDKSLYWRNEKEFRYTVKVFEIVLNPQMLSRYYRNTDDISIDDLFDKSGRIKPAGGPDTASDLDTIFGTVESWSGEGYSNEQPRDSHRKSEKLTTAQKKEIRKASEAKGIKFLTDVKNPERDDIVYVMADRKIPKKHGSFDWDLDTAGYYQYTGYKWIKLEDDD